MTTTTAPVASQASRLEPGLVRTARATGLWYLGLAITGLAGMLLFRNQLFVADDPAATLANLQEHDWLARGGVLMEMGVVATQTMAALWFFRLFRRVDSFAAGALTAFGLVNAIAILGSAALLGTAVDVAGDASLAPAGDTAASVQLLYVTSGQLWGVGALFFGLWLIPMGWLVLRSHWLPQALGWLLMGGGAGYVLSAFATYVFPDADAVTSLLTVPATIGEFWILGYLILVGVRDRNR